MKLTNDLIEKFGWDKVLHFVLAFVIATIFIPTLSVAGLFGGFALAVILSIVKEYKLDDTPNPDDLRSGILGAVLGFLWYLFWMIIL